MFELARHIEILLLDNDCVIIPDFGGFVAHYFPARWNDDENVFLPPMRMIGFNPLLRMNDGLLVQSYMKTYDTNFSDATKILDTQTKSLIQRIQEESKVEFPNIGEVLYSVHGTYTFSPYDNKMASPQLYGLDTFEIPELKDLQQQPALNRDKKVIIPLPVLNERDNKLRIPPTLIRNITGAAAVAVVAVFLFFLSTPLDNTYSDNGNYAQLLPAGIIEQLDKYSLLTTTIDYGHSSTNNNEIEIVADEVPMSMEPVAPEATIVPETSQPADVVAIPQQDTVKKTPFHLVVASVNRQSDADKMVKQLKSQGYPDAKVVKGNGKIRVSIMSFSHREEAERQLGKLRQNDTYHNSWLLVR